MKKNATRYCAGPAVQDAQQTFTVQNKPAAAAEAITHHFFVSGIGRRHQCGKIWQQKMLLKQKPSKHCKWIARFLFLALYSTDMYITHNNCMKLPIV